jgi:HK97 family phage prohead protease
MSDMSYMPAHAQARLDAVLSGPVVGSSRHAQVVDLARQRVHEHERQGHHEYLEYSAYAKAATADVAADVTADVLGEFEAVVSDFLPDRQGERFAPHAFDGALDRIRKNGTACPVLFGHKQDTVSSVLGMVPSTGWSITNDGLTAKGWIDVSDSVGAKVYKMLRNGSLLWSIGFRIVTGNKSRRGSDGTVVIDRVDELLELSVVPVPANSRTRTVGMKADHPAPTAAELRGREIRLGLGSAVDSLERNRRMIVPSVDELAARAAALGDLPFVERILIQRAPSLDAAVERLRQQTREEMTRILGGGDTGKAYASRTPHRRRDEQRARAQKVAQEFELERALTFDGRAG